MPFPRRFQSLIETTLEDVAKPDYAWLTYAVCAVKKKSCGWAGWIIEGVSRYSAELRASTGRNDPLPADNDAKCPRCGLPLFRTRASLRFEPSSDQTSPNGVPGIDYEVLPVTYHD
jgi:hypothetical protein